ncbi:MAG TPA: hypothetical protein VF718_12425 [Allosphingosinicella sp.]
MSRLIEIGTDPVERLTVRVGDVMSFSASGGTAGEEGPAVELLGAFSPAVVATNGEVLSPETPPTTVLFRAAAAGRARLTLFSGQDWSSPLARTVDVTVRD